jgi:hypothetical protein
MKYFLLLRVNSEKDANFIALTIPCKSFNLKKAQLGNDVFIIANNVNVKDLDLNHIMNNPHVKVIILRKEE